MSLTFDSFPHTAAAENFANEVRVRFNLRAGVFYSQDESERKRAEVEMGVGAMMALDFFALSPPIVLVKRAGLTDDDFAKEEAVRQLVATFKGKYVGT